MERILFIINPRSGVDRVKALKNLIEKELDHTIYSYEIAYTEYAKHGTALAREGVEKGFDIIAAVGGDGSVNDVINGIHGSNARLAIIPKGSGNGLARSLNIPMDASAAIHVINRNKSEKIDLGRADGRIFVSNVGVGFDTLVARKFAKSERRGMAVYSWIVTKHLWGYKEWDWEIEADGKKFTERAFILTVANAQQFGYNFKIAPTADLQDGKFDVVIIKHFPRILGSMIALRGFRGTLLNSRFVKHFKAEKVAIRHPQLRLLQTDGDIHACGSSVEIEILPSALQVITV